MNYDRNVLIGLCQGGYHDTMTLLVFNLYDDFVSSLLLKKCIGCCIPSNIFDNTHAFYDAPFSTLFITTAKNTYYTIFEEKTVEMIDMKHLQYQGSTMSSKVFFIPQAAIKIYPRTNQRRCLSGPIILFFVEQIDAEFHHVQVIYCFKNSQITTGMDSRVFEVSTNQIANVHLKTHRYYRNCKLREMHVISRARQ